jgi:hypothetical protein
LGDVEEVLNSLVNDKVEYSNFSLSNRLLLYNEDEFISILFIIPFEACSHRLYPDEHDAVYVKRQCFIKVYFYCQICSNKQEYRLFRISYGKF